MPLTGCNNPLIPIPGTGYNTVNVPGPNSKGYTSITDQLLYEIWQTDLLILAALAPPGMAKAIIFTIGDGQPGTPLTGTTSLHAPMLQGQNLADKQLLVIRNSIPLRYYDGINHYEIIRFNDHTDGGFDFDPASGLSFQTGDDFQIYIISINTTVAP